jgi:hypothetical protein
LLWCYLEWCLPREWQYSLCELVCKLGGLQLKGELYWCLELWELESLWLVLELNL